MYEKYAKLRDERGLNDNQVAKKTGIARSTFSDWKKGVYQPKIDKLIKIANLLNVSVDYFIKQ